MSTLNYTQYGLAPMLQLEELEESAEPVVFVVTLGVKDGRITLDYGQKGTDKDYIAITCNTRVEIVLEGDQLYFSKDYDAITTKEALSSFYGALAYDGYDKELDRYKIVRFIARYNKNGKVGTKHPFNINVDLLQSSDGEEPRFIALTIDPTINNPPPMN